MAILSYMGCNTVQFVPEGKYLLQKEVAIKGNKALTSDQVYEAVRMRANRRMLRGPKTFLYMYNLGKIIEYDSTLFKKLLLRRDPIREYYYPLVIKSLTEDFGEAPVLIDVEAIKKDSINIRNLYFANGYFSPTITCETDTPHRFFQYQKMRLAFKIVENNPHKIGVLSDSIADPFVKSLYYQTLDKSTLRINNNYNHADMDAERNRIAAQMRDNGFFNFSPNMVNFVVYIPDTAAAKRNKYVPDGEYDQNATYLKIVTHISEKTIQYRIGVIKDSLISAFFDDRKEDYFASFRTDTVAPDIRVEIPTNRLEDTTLHLAFKVSANLLKEVNFDFIGQRIKLKEGEMFSRTKTQETQRDLQRLTMFQYVNMSYFPNDSTKTIDIKITNKLSPRFAQKIGAEVFTNVVNDQSNLNSGLNMSLGVNGSLRNRNTFSHSEQSEISLAGLVGLYRPRTGADSGQVKLLYEVRAKASIDFPRFITPSTRFNRKNFSMYNPTSSLLASVRLESRREYRRVTVGGNISYRWNHIPYKSLISSQFTPLALDIISVPENSLAPDFLQVLQRSPQLLRDFQPRFSSRTLYSYTHSDYMSNRAKPTFFLRGSFEEAGTIPYILDNLLGLTSLDTTTIADQSLYFDKKNPIFYARYFKLTGEGKYFIPLWKNGEIVLRGYIGTGLKWKNTLELPIQNRFYSGGTNSMRGWQSNLLGPGLIPQDSNRIVPRGGDYALEMNAEFRFKMYSYFNLALFTDLGNTWFGYNSQLLALYPTDAMKMVLIKPASEPNRLSNFKLGWDVGIGLRADFTFLVFRVDLAQQVYLPQYQDFVWNINFEKDTRRLYRNLSVGIGYPF